MALQGAKERAQSEVRNVITGSWLNGRLVMADQKTYPSLEEMLGEEPEPEGDYEPEPGAEHIGAKLWIMYLNRK